MYARIARQPVFNTNKEVYGYDLLYRGGPGDYTGSIRAAREEAEAKSVLSDAITIFGLANLTNHLPAFIHFTENLLVDGFAYLADRKDLVIEVSGGIEVNDDLRDKLRELKKAGYRLALREATGDHAVRDILRYFDYLRVDFAATEQLEYWSGLLQKTQSGIRLLVENIETLEAFQQACRLGGTLFQGTFFDRPKVISQRVPELATTSYGNLLNELQKPVIDFAACSRIIQNDAVLTYLFLRQIQTANYYRGNQIVEIKRGIVMMGSTELRRWLLLVLLRQNNVTHSDELARQCYLRGRFIERLMECSDQAPDSSQGFLLGMFSLLDKILGTSMDELLKDLQIDPELKTALLGLEENTYSIFLQYVMIYEMKNSRLLFPDIHLRLAEQEVPALYMQCVAETDQAFDNLGGQRQ